MLAAYLCTVDWYKLTSHLYLTINFAAS